MYYTAVLSPVIRRINWLAVFSQFQVEVRAGGLTSIAYGADFGAGFYGVTGCCPQLSTRQKHTRECFVVLKDGADPARVENEIKTMPNYFADYDTTVHFISMEELKQLSTAKTNTPPTTDHMDESQERIAERKKQIKREAHHYEFICIKVQSRQNKHCVL